MGGRPSSEAEEERLAAALLAARRSGSRLGDVPAPRDAAAAYRVQARVMGALGAVGGWKTGRRAPDGPQIMAPIPAGVLRPSPAVFGAGELNLVGIELEIGFRITAPLPPAADPDFAARARACVAAAPMIEVVDARIADPDGPDPLLKLADNQVNGGLVVGAAREGFGALAEAEVELWIGGERVAAGRAAVPGGDAFDVLCGLARMVGDHCGGLRVGQHVTTGTLTGLRFVDRGRPVRGRIEGLGEVSADFPA